MEIEGLFEQVHKDLDKGKNSIKTMEHFIDKYMPIRIQQMVNETLYKIELSKN